jgi:hypothetical protein
VDARLRTVEKVVGVSITSGGLFRTRYDLPYIGHAWVTVIAAVVGEIRWLRRRSRSPFPNYVVLAASKDTLFVYAAAIAEADIGDELARWPLDEVRATRGQDAWAIDITIDGRTHNFTGASMDGASLDLIDRLTATVK